ncbi:MAG: UDP-N-acetylglucosamine 2-epimerase (non-hydrolyzing) [Novosphingobium sp.]
MKKVLLVFGTRPEAIKMAPVHAELRDVPGIEVRVAVTAQHREMLDQVLDLYKISADYDLNIMSHSQNLEDVTVNSLNGMGNILNHYVPDIVVVHGDTTTTLSASLASYYQKIPVAHVEAGLRTGNIYAPWPEEINRKVVSSIAHLHFAPTEESVANLQAEAVSEQSIFLTGNTVIDSLIRTVDVLESDDDLSRKLDEEFALDPSKRMILVTAHRRENFGDGLKDIFTALLELAKRNDIQIVYPLHPNPNVNFLARSMMDNVDSIKLIDHQDYMKFVHLMRRSYIIMTDSGGIQEEAPSLGKPVLVMRDVTERPEAVTAGTVKLVGTDANLILREVNALLDYREIYDGMARAHNPYGDGLASKRIVDAIVNYLRRSEMNA